MAYADELSATIAERVSTPEPASRPAGSPRRDWLDVLKGIGIALVVLGHVIRGLVAAGIVSGDGAWGAIDRGIYAFHMPLFFVVSGLFLLPGPRATYADFAKKKVLRIGYPYVVWASLQTAVQIALSRHTNSQLTAVDLLAIVYAPPMQFWFLYVLLLLSLGVGLLAKLGVSRRGLSAVAVVALVTEPFVPLGAWGVLYPARSYLLYVVLGVLLGAPGALEAFEKRSRATHAALFAAGVAAVTWLALDGSAANRYVAAAVACAGVVGTASAAILVAGGPAAAEPALGRLGALLGRASMEIFVAHTLALAGVRIALQKLLHVDDAVLHVALGIAAGIVFPLALRRAAVAVGFECLFAWPERGRAVAPAPMRAVATQGDAAHAAPP